MSDIRSAQGREVTVCKGYTSQSTEHWNQHTSGVKFKRGGDCGRYAAGGKCLSYYKKGMVRAGCPFVQRAEEKDLDQDKIEKMSLTGYNTNVKIQEGGVPILTHSNCTNGKEGDLKLGIPDPGKMTNTNGDVRKKRNSKKRQTRPRTRKEESRPGI